MRSNPTKFIIGITLIFIMSIFCIAVVSATPITVMAKPSASSNLHYKDYTKTWENYCPLCQEKGTLIFNPKNTYEGELTCSACGADYCAVTGKDKHGRGPREFLTPAKNTKNLTKENKSSSNKSGIFRNLEELNFESYSQITISLLQNILVKEGKNQ